MKIRDIESIVNSNLSLDVALRLVKENSDVNVSLAALLDRKGQDAFFAGEYWANYVYKVCAGNAYLSNSQRAFQSTRAAGFCFDKASKSAETLELLDAAIECRKKAAEIYKLIHYSIDERYAREEILRLERKRRVALGQSLSDEEHDALINGNR